MIAPTQNQSNRNQQNSTANHKAVVSAEQTFRSIFPQNLSRKYPSTINIYTILLINKNLQLYFRVNNCFIIFYRHPFLSKRLSVHRLSIIPCEVQAGGESSRRAFLSAISLPYSLLPSFSQYVKLISRRWTR